MITNWTLQLNYWHLSDIKLVPAHTLILRSHPYASQIKATLYIKIMKLWRRWQHLNKKMPYPWTRLSNTDVVSWNYQHKISMLTKSEFYNDHSINEKWPRPFTGFQHLLRGGDYAWFFGFFFQKPLLNVSMFKGNFLLIFF